MHRLAPLLLACMLPACSAVTLSGLTAAAQLDPLNTPPDDITLAVSLPPQVQLSDGDAVLSLALAGPDGPLVSETVPLQVTEAETILPGLTPGDRLFLADLAPPEAERIADAQAEIRRLRDSGQSGQGSLFITIQSGCLTAPLDETLPIATWLRPASDARFIRLTRRSDLFAQLPADESATLRDALPPCP